MRMVDVSVSILEMFAAKLCIGLERCNAWSKIKSKYVNRKSI